MEEGELNQVFLDSVKDDDGYHRAVDVVRENCQGRFWLIGGSLFRNIASGLYKQDQPPIKDFDFIVEDPKPNLSLPIGWKSEINSFENPKLTSFDGLQIDFIPLNNIYHLNTWDLKPSIDNFLEYVALTVQSICFDVLDSKVIGEIGIKAIQTKTVAVNNSWLASWYAGKIGLSLEDYIKKEAQKLNFTPILF